MRDGIALATDIYRPVTSEQRLASIFIATPYGKQTGKDAANFFASHGYVVAVQDVRGKYGSPGEFVIEHHEGVDGYDTVEWLSRQAWSNGKVGTYGCSYMGAGQVYQAREPHAALAAQIIQAPGGLGGEYRADGTNGPRRGGALLLGDALPYFYGYMRKHGPDELPSHDISESILWHLPIKTMMEAAGVTSTDWIDYMGKGYADPWWKTFGSPTEKDSITRPAIFVTGWFDFAVEDTINLWSLFRRNASASGIADEYLIIAPTDHCKFSEPSEAYRIGDLDAGDARFDFWKLYLDWFDFWLRGKTSTAVKMAKVQYFTTGSNVWRSSDVWPPRNAKVVRAFLDSDGKANTRAGNGTLRFSPPKHDTRDQIVYDPANPVLTALTTNFAKLFGSIPLLEGEAAREDRSDVLVYTSEPLERGLEVTGPIRLTLSVSSDVKDTDFTAWLCDVDEKAKSYNLQAGILRARYRNGYGKEIFLQPNDVVEISINLRAISHYFKPRHRIRIVVSSSNFPQFDRNLNTGGDNFTETTWRIARNSVHHSPEHQSYLSLPIVSGYPTVPAARNGPH
jgi:putative CocE/NonD family hydrolase